MSPQSGPISGSTIVSLTGSGFVGIDSVIVRFSNGSKVLNTSAVFVNSGLLNVTTPAFASAGVYTVSVLFNGQQVSGDAVSFVVYGTSSGV
mgnify:CR=1 FL=1